MTIEEYYRDSTRGYVEFLDLLIEVGKEDPETKLSELKYLKEHRLFAEILLDELIAEV